MSASDYGRKYMRRKRIEAEKRGTCRQCLHTEVLPGRKRCARCTEHNNESTRRYYERHREAVLARVRAAKFCTECIAAGFHRADCAERSR